MKHQPFTKRTSQGIPRRYQNLAEQSPEVPQRGVSNANGTGKADMKISGDNKYAPRRQLGGKASFSAGIDLNTGANK